MNEPLLPTKRGLVKICGMREPEHAVAAALSGADLIGFVFAPSRRQIDHGRARACVQAARSAARGGSVLAVGVFVDASLQEIETAVEVVGLDMVQCHGSRPADVTLTRALTTDHGEERALAPPRSSPNLGVPRIQAIRTPPGTTSAEVLARIAAERANDDPPVSWLVDGYDPGLHGGTGIRADWHLAAEVAAVAPLILAGGLTPDNVVDAIRVVRPFAVDVSGGVETDGRKDPAKIAAFISAARIAFDADGLTSRSPV